MVAERLFLAVYIDLENLPADLSLARLIEDTILRSGEQGRRSEPVLAIKLACGDTASIAKLRDQLLAHNFDIREAPHISNSSKKNRADLILSLEAFESLYIAKPTIDRYVFVTSDADFTVVMDKLRKHGKQVWLVSRREDSQRAIFNNSCDEILVLEDYKKAAETDFVAPPQPGSSTVDDRAVELMTRVLESFDADRWYYQSDIGARFHALDKGLDLRHTRFKSIGGLILHMESQRLLETTKSEKGHVTARLPESRR